MEQLTAYFLTVLEIIEKELAIGRLIAAKTVRGLGWFVAGVFLLGIGVLFLGWTCFAAVSLLVGPVAAGLAASALILAGGMVFLWNSRKNLK